jgi:phosphoribosylamine--glycine ligase
VPIIGLEAAAKVEGVQIFHSGTAMKEGKLVTAGGRVLGVTAIGETLAAARAKAYEAIGHIHFEGMQYRKDIGEKAVAASRR